MSSVMHTPESFARALLARFKLSKCDNPYDLATRIGLRIKEVNSKDFDGALIRIPNKPVGIIALRRDIRELGRKHFTICHEIGHYILPGHGELECICKNKNIDSWGKGVPDQELAANRFASELLLPSAQIRTLVKKHLATISLAKTISNDYATSLTAAALKCIEVTEENCALVMITKDVIDWVKPGDYFRYFISKGVKLNSLSLASKFSAYSDHTENNGYVPADAWLSSQQEFKHNARVWEDSILLPRYDKIITIITINESIE